MIQHARLGAPETALADLRAQRDVISSRFLVSHVSLAAMVNERPILFPLNHMRTSLVNESGLLIWSHADENYRLANFFVVVNRVWRVRRGAATDSRGAQLSTPNGRNRSRSRTAVRTEHAGDAMGRRAGCESTTMGQRMYISA